MFGSDSSSRLRLNLYRRLRLGLAPTLTVGGRVRVWARVQAAPITLCLLNSLLLLSGFHLKVGVRVDLGLRL